MPDDILSMIADGQGEKTAETLYLLCKEHAAAYLQYEKFRAIKASCYSDAKDAAGEKPVTDTYLERAIIARHGHDVLESGKALFHKLEALQTQITAFSAIFTWDAAQPLAPVLQEKVPHNS